MNKKYCANCYFGNTCPSDKICDGYIPLDEDFINDDIDDVIEQKRVEFHKEWRKYITQWDN